MANPIAFEQDPQMPAGVGTFRFDDGASLYAEEPELAMRLSAVPDARLAQNDLGVNRDVGAWANPNAPQPQAMPVADVRPAPQPAPAPAPVPVQEQQQPVEQSPYSPEEMAYISRPVVQPGRPAVDPYRMRAQGVPVPQTITTTVKGTTPAPPIPEELRQRYAGAAQQYEDVQNERVQLEQERAYTEQMRAEREQRQAAEELMQVRMFQNAKENAYREKRAALQQQIDGANQNERVNTNMFAQRGTFGGIMLAIGQALSAAAGPQYLAQFNSMLTRQTELDVAEQERQLRERKGARANQLAAFTEQWGGDVEAGKLALKIAQDKLVNKEIAAYAASTRNEDVALRAQEWLAQRELEQAQREQELYVRDMGGGQEMTQVISEQVVQPQRATGGGVRAPSIEERYERAGKLGKLKAGIVESERTVAGEPDPNVVARYGRREERADRQVLTEYAEKKTAIQDSRTATDQLARAYGANVDWKTGKVEAPKGGIPGHGATRFVPDILTTPEGMAVRQAQDKALAAYLKATTGAAATEAEMARARRVIMGSTDKDAARGLRTLVEEIRNREASVESEYGPDVVETHEARQRDVNLRRAAPAPKVRPY